MTFKEHKLTEEECCQVIESGRTPETIQKQLTLFAMGVPFLNVVRPATPEDGINLMCNRQEEFLEASEKEIARGRVCKFVPASGAASRMFKDLSSFIDSPDNSSEEVHIFVERFFDNLHRFPFYKEVSKHITIPDDVSGLNTSNKVDILKAIVCESGLGYGSLPKAVIPFHIYKDSIRTAIEEQLVEAALYTKDTNNQCRISFTVSNEHLPLIKTLIDETIHCFQEQFNVKYLIDFSTQSKESDTIAVDNENKPFLHKGKLLFRPGGHGALLRNLNQVQSPFISIKNIDNVGPDRVKHITILWKKIMTGVACVMQNECNKKLRRLLKNGDTNSITEAVEFLKTINTSLPPHFDTEVPHIQKNILIALLDRPLRVCGMVKNQGEPGGGPFWVSDPEGNVSLQIVESSQIDPDEREDLMGESTHFNPVDIIVAKERHDGSLFNLEDFTDENAVFISNKSKDGHRLKALELPGLWNGAMAKWNTIFIDVPIETFSPVKTVNDLLRPEHQC